MNITIKEGSHYCSGYSLAGIHTGKTFEMFSVMFDRSCLKLPGDTTCDKDINKLFGWSYGSHHSNSIRVGWRSERGQVHLFAYLYMNGVRSQKSIGWIPVEKLFNVSAKHDTANNEVVFIVAGAVTRIPWKGCAPCIGYNLRPYYGGNCSAPTTMVITLL